MRLHLPKGLLAAILAAFAALPGWAASYTAGTSTSPITSGLIQATPVDGGTAAGLGTLASSDTVSIYTSGGYLPSGGTIDAALEIKQLILTNGTTDTTYTFNGAITGESDAVFRVNSRAQGSATGYVIPQTFKFVGDLSRYYGSIEQGASSTDTSYNGLKLQFSGTQESNTVAAVIRNSLGEGTISSNTEFTSSSIDFGTLTIDANKSMTVNAATTLTVSSALNNNGSLVLNGTYTGSTISQAEGATLTLGTGSVVNLDDLNLQYILEDSDRSGVQSYQCQYTLVSGGSVSKAEDATVTFNLGDAEVGGTLSNGSYILSSSSKCYNIASGTSQTYSEVSTAIGTESIDFINVIGTLTELSYPRGTTPFNIKGTGTVQVNGVLEYYSTTDHTFLNDFGGILEIVSGGDVRLGSSTTQLDNLTKIKVLSGGILRGYSSAKPLADLELAGGTLLASGQNWTYGAGILVSADSRLSQSGSETLTITGAITNLNNAGITSTGTVTLQGAVTLSSCTVQSGTVTMEGNATLGDIIVQSGTLNLGKVSGAAYAAKDISVGDVTVNAGATFSVGYTKGTVESVSLAAGAKLRYYDNQTPLITEASDTTTIKKLTVSAAATLQADWKGTLNISELTGSGNLALKKIQSAYDPYFYLNIASIKDYSGTITGPDTNASFMTVTIGEANISDAADTATVSANVTLASGFTKTGEGAVSFGGTTTATDVTVSSGSLTFAGGTSISKLSLNGGTATISGATSVSGVKGDGIIAANDAIKLTVSDTGTLTHDGFEYTGTELRGLSHGLTMWNKDDTGSTSYNVSVTGGTITQKENEKTIHASLSGVKLINGTDNSDMITTLGANANLSAASIAGKLIVEKETTVTGAATISGTAEVKGTLSTGAGSTITTLTGSGALKSTAGAATVSDASGFTGTLESTGGALTATNVSSTNKLAAVKATGGQISLYAKDASVSVAELTIGTNGQTLAYTGQMELGTVTADKVSIGESNAKFQGNLNITGGLTVQVGSNGQTGGLNMAAAIGGAATGTLTLGSATGTGLELNLSYIPVMTTNDTLTLFTGVDRVLYYEIISAGTGETEAAAVTLSDPTPIALTEIAVDASKVFNNVDSGYFTVKFVGNNVILTASTNVPEPTTATLSLLALMGLAARRRRRKA